ncbi:MAG: hypothetical protein IJA61_03710 [Clostridia bacterium]|nr:hypothetical protein [Clostridia bacterium]
MKKCSLITISIILSLLLSLYVYFAVKYSDSYTNLFTVISCILTCIATISLGIISVWQTLQYRDIEEKRHYLPNLLVFCFDKTRSNEKVIFKAILTKETEKVNILINVPNGTIYQLYLKSAKIYNNELLISSIDNKDRNITYLPGVYDNIIKQQETLDAAILIDRQYSRNKNYHFDLEFEYYNIEGKLITKILRMKYNDDSYTFETRRKANFL